MKHRTVFLNRLWSAQKVKCNSVILNENVTKVQSPVFTAVVSIRRHLCSAVRPVWGGHSALQIYTDIRRHTDTLYKWVRARDPQAWHRYCEEYTMFRSETEDVLSYLLQKHHLRIFCICHSIDIRIEEPFRQTPSDNNAAHGGSGDKITESQFISSHLIWHEHNTLIRMLRFLRARCRRCAVHCVALLHLAAT